MRELARVMVSGACIFVSTGCGAAQVGDFSRVDVEVRSGPQPSIALASFPSLAGTITFNTRVEAWAGGQSELLELALSCTESDRRRPQATCELTLQDPNSPGRTQTVAATGSLRGGEDVYLPIDWDGYAIAVVVLLR